MSNTKYAFLELSEELGLAPAQLLEKINSENVKLVVGEELTVEEAKHQRSAERAGDEALNLWGR